jgi:ABC-type transport system involved in multi-copper enzyme maturation permease subunit
MEASTTKPVSYNRWLPYWAVFQADIHQTMRSWIYRFWVVVSVLALVGYLLYRLGPVHIHNILDSTPQFMGDLLRWTVVSSLSLIVVLAAGAISGERGTLADSILSRGISRYQYFLGKWHARLVVVLSTYLILSSLALICSLFLLHEKLSPTGSAFALGVVAALLGAVVSCSVAVSALTNSTLVGITILWMILYGGGLALAHLPENFPSIDRTLRALPWILQGNFHHAALWPLILWCCVVSVTAALVGMIGFARRDV